MDDDDDASLYAGLDSIPPAPRSPDRAQHAPEPRETAASDALQRVVARLLKENDDLRVQNDTLARNISTLFHTAKAELSRKDREIERLRG
ncbi:hypothetical protein M885DRAFT_565570 [Pelagophyceae sp. CCMP2097]|nr:hypothetical protein M885DRAFT_565570 [Pelagophyceae sp. CCMP2097]